MIIEAVVLSVGAVITGSMWLADRVMKRQHEQVRQPQSFGNGPYRTNANTEPMVSTAAPVISVPLISNHDPRLTSIENRRVLLKEARNDKSLRDMLDGKHTVSMQDKAFARLKDIDQQLLKLEDEHADIVRGIQLSKDTAECYRHTGKIMPNATSHTGKINGG